MESDILKNLQHTNCQGYLKWVIQKQTAERFSSKKSEHPEIPLKSEEIFETKVKPSADHRTLDQQLDLFSTSDEIGSGLVLWHPKGALIRRAIRDIWEEMH